MIARHAPKSCSIIRSAVMDTTASSMYEGSFILALSSAIRSDLASGAALTCSSTLKSSAFWAASEDMEMESPPRAPLPFRQDWASGGPGSGLWSLAGL